MRFQAQNASRPASLSRPQGLGDINTLASTVQQVEGYIAPNSQYPQGSLAYQNNNPGNLRYAGQPGATLGTGGFAKFPSYAAGYQALLNQIQYQATPGYRSPADGSVYPNGQTLSQFINTYAPSSENNTSAYLAQLTASTGYGPNDLLSTVISGLAPSALAPGTTDISDNLTSDSTDDSTGIDLTDPTTLGLAAVVGIVAWYLLS